MPTNLDMDALRTFVAGLELASFAQAARRLGRSQSAISMQLRKLEQQTGRTLVARKGRGLVATEAGEALLDYARRIIALNDEAAASLGATAAPAAVRIGLPQDFFADLVPGVLRALAARRPGVHVEVQAGRNHALEAEVRARRLDTAIVFARPGTRTGGRRILALPMRWFARRGAPSTPADAPVPLVVYDHPCLFRQAAIQALDRSGRSWRPALTTPSLPGVWAAVKVGQGLTVRIRHGVPAGIEDVSTRHRLPALPPIEVRLLRSDALSPAGEDLHDILETTLQRLVAD